MRKQFVATVEDILRKDKSVSLLLGDIGVYGFKKAFEQHPERVFNIGILEQSTISLSAGMAMSGLIPVIHTIAPFMVERCFEQIKDDFGYQALGGNLVSVGASYDYAALGCTHHSPADVPILAQIPTIEIVVPGNSQEFDILFRQAYNNGKLTYFRLSERENKTSVPVQFGKVQIVKKGTNGTVIAVGPLLDKVVEATTNIDVTILYVHTVRPLDIKSITKNITANKLLICEPYYSGALTIPILEATHHSVLVEHVGVPMRFLTKYGSPEQHDSEIGLTSQAIRDRVKKLIHE